MQPIEIPAALSKEHYEKVSVGHLAMIFHYLFPLPSEPNGGEDLAAAWDSFRRVNARFAGAVAGCRTQDPVLVQDYHLLLVAQELRRMNPLEPRPLLYFHHVSWCQSDYFGALPSAMRTETLRGLLAFDMVGFHSRRWADAFLTCCERFVPEAVLDEGSVTLGGRVTKVISSPAAVDAHDILAGVHSAEYRDWCKELRRLAAGRWVLGRVDRVDLWKNPLRGLLAIEEFLSRHPEDSGRIWFPMVLTPTRTWRGDYQDYLEECRNRASRINALHPDGTDGGPVKMFIADDPLRPDRALALALMSTADGLLVNPTIDGLNIVPKESSILSEKNPVVILSENAGIYEEINDMVIGVNPFDIRQTAEGIYLALHMPMAERERRGREITRRTRSWSPRSWVEEQLKQCG